LTRRSVEEFDLKVLQAKLTEARKRFDQAYGVATDERNKLAEKAKLEEAKRREAEVPSRMPNALLRAYRGIDTGATYDVVRQVAGEGDHLVHEENSDGVWDTYGWNEDNAVLVLVFLNGRVVGKKLTNQ
jgi:hypothetical protein